MADILRDLADKLDGIEGGNQESTTQHLTAVKLDKPAETEAEVMIPPLQQKLEILKKSAGMDNALDVDSNNELEDIKKLTGLKAVVGHVAGEDNDITG